MLDKQYPVVHSAGINKDRFFQESNDVTFALNAIRDNHEGGRQEYQSEPGNQISANLPAGYIINGSIYGQNEEIYIFSTNGSLSEIGLFKQDTYNTLANLNLGFNLNYPITGEYRVKKGCERTIYWCDKLNNDYWFNIDRPEDFKTGGVFDPNKFKHVPVILPISTDLISVNETGGITALGSYFFQPEILDIQGNVLYSGDITPQTIIYDDSQSLNYYKIDGGLNIEQYDPAIGGVPMTSKSITLRFSNLNTSFSYLRVNVFRSINGTQVIDGHTVATLIPITGESVDWTYQGYNTSAGDFPIDVSEKLIDRFSYDSAYVSEQVQGRYVRANLKQTNKDYSTYQSFASSITMKWVAKEVEAANPKALGNAKNPETYWYNKTFQGDEVYAPGIQYIHDDGIVSPIFPTIARPATSTDLEVLTVVPNNATLGTNEVWLSDVEHLGLDINALVPRWKVFNTATVTDFDFSAHPYTYEGEFGYYESDETYPDVRDCDDNLLWGQDSESNEITTSTKIRFVKFPDRRLISHISSDGTYTVPYGIKFGNITYPNPSVIGHRFVFADRTEFDKTVVDAGWAVTPSTLLVDGKTVTSVGGIGDFYRHNFLSPSNPNSQRIRFNSPKTLFENSASNFSYYKTNRVHEFGTGVIGTNAPFDYAKKGDNYSIICYMKHKNSNIPQRTAHSEVITTFVEPGGITLAQSPLIETQSSDYYTGDTISYVNYGLENTTALLGPQLINIVFNSSETQINVHNFYTYKKNDVSAYSNLLSRNYKLINHNYVTPTDENVFYGGDSIIAECQTFRWNGQYGSINKYLYTPLYHHHFVEQSTNTALRHLGTEPEFKYFKIGDTDDYNFDRIPESGLVSEIIPEYYKFNIDYNVRLFQKAKTSLPIQYDYCSGCSGYYPNRIIFSPKSFDEESFDLYRINLVNDYIDMPAHRGAITGLKYQNNQLLVHMEDSTFILQPNPQQISTDQNTAYLTTGDFLSVPPQELLQTDVGTAGLQSKQSMCNTPFGHCWADQKRGELFSWSGQLDILSNKGLLQWFKENLPSELDKEYFKVYGTNPPQSSTLSLQSKGVILYYDPRFKRLLVTKKEFLPISLKYSFDDFDSGNDVMYLEPYGWVTLDGGIQPVPTTDPDFFINKSWTLSYEFLNQSWTSWHSYLPYYSFADSNNFYSTIYGSSIYKHLSKGLYQNYYGSKYDFIIEWQNMDPVSTDVSNLYYVGYSHVWDDVNKQFKTVDTTFDKLLMYNFEQSTGLQNLILQNQNSTSPYGNTSILSNSKYVIKTDQNYKIAGLYDMSIAQPVMTEDWIKKQLYPGYIDLVPNSTNINFNKSPYDWGNIWDKFVNIRLFYKPTEDHRKSVLLQVLNSQQSIR